MVFFPVSEVLEEIESFLSSSPVLDYITFSGSGEPTLSLSIGPVIRFIKEKYPSYRVAVLTNGSLLSNSDVRMDLLQADLILPTLSTVYPNTFESIHHPISEFSVEDIITGIMRFKTEYTGKIWMEVFIIPGLNSSDVEIGGLREIITTINPDRVQINTMDRPGTEDWVRAPDAVTINRILTLLNMKNAEWVGSPSQSYIANTGDSDGSYQVYEMIRRRPCTIEDITASTRLDTTEVVRILQQLTHKYDLHSKQEIRGLFYYIKERT